MPMALAILLLFSAFLHFLPQWTRPALFFSVTVEPAFRSTAEARRITRRYRIMLWSCAAAALGLLLVTGRLEAIFLEIAGYYAAMAVAHRRALAHAVPAASAVEVNLAAPRESFPGGPVAMLAPLAAIGALTLWASRHWDRLPQRFPVHWGMHGPDRWILRTPTEVYSWLGFNAAMSLLFVLLAAGILYRSRRASTRCSVAFEERRFRRINVQIFLVLACLPRCAGVDHPAASPGHRAVAGRRGHGNRGHLLRRADSQPAPAFGSRRRPHAGLLLEARHLLLQPC